MNGRSILRRAGEQVVVRARKRRSPRDQDRRDRADAACPELTVLDPVSVAARGNVSTWAA